MKKRMKDPRVMVTVLTGLLCILLFGFILETIQNQMVLRNMQSEMARTMDYIDEAYQISREYFPNVRGSIQEIRTEELQLLKYFSEEDPEFAVTDEYLAEVNEEFNLADVMVADEEGNILASASGSRNPLRGRRFDPLRESFETETVGVVSMVSDKDAWDTMQNLSVPETAAYNYYSMYILYSLPLDEHREFVLMEYGVPVLNFENTVNSWWELLKNITVGVNGYAFAWKDSTWEILYYPDESLRFEHISVLNMDMENLTDGAYGWNKVNGKRMYLHTVHNEDEGVWIACAVPEEELVTFTRFSVVSLWIVFALLAADTIYYALLLLRRDTERPAGIFPASFTEDRTGNVKTRLLVFTILLSTAIFLLSFYIRTLYSMSSWADDSERKLQNIEERLMENDINAREYAYTIEMDKYAETNLVVRFIEKNPDKVNDLFLNKMAVFLNLWDLTIYDASGKVRTSSSDELYRNLNLEQAVGDVSAVTKGSVPVWEKEDISGWMSIGGIKLLTPIYRENGDIDGYLYGRYYSQQANTVLENQNPFRTIELVQPGEGSFLFAVDSENKKFVYYPDGSLTGRDAREYGLEEEKIRDNFHDFVHINKTSYYAASRLIDKNLIYYSISTDDLFRQRLPVAAIVGIVTFAFLLLIGLPLYTSGEQELKPADTHENTDAKASSPGTGVSPEYKAYGVLSDYAAGFAALFVLFHFIHEKIAFSSVINYVMVGSWERGFNVFALTAALLYLCRGVLLIFVGRRFVRALARCLPSRGGTIVRMLASLATYIGIFFVAYLCLVCFGMNPTTLMASAGIVSVVLGIGANSLVGDILAGIFLLTEGDIQVGDVIKIGEFRGYVQEMGIRRTKIYDLDNEDLRIVPNREIQDVVNMSRHASLVYNKFQISYEENLERVEILLREELKNMYGQVPYLLSAPEYLGVRELGDNGITLICSARCHEAFRFRVERAINRRVYMMFKKNGIEIPYPQVQIRE